MLIGYSGKSSPTAHEIATQSDEIEPVRSSRCDINWGRSDASNARLNPDISKTTNKRIMRQLFKEYDVPMPYLYEQTPFVYPVVGRPDVHTRGRGFWKCNNILDVKKALKGTRKKKAATHFMEYIEAPREYRVHIFQGKSIRISEKSFGETGLTAHGNYITRKPQHNVNHVRAAAKKAVEAVGLDFGAVDILANDTDCWVLEVNSAPSLGGSLPKVYAQKFKEVMSQ